MTELTIPKLSTRADVAALLGMSTKEMTWWLWGFKGDTYTRFEIPRRDGADPRVIRAPIKPVKDMQRKLLSELGESYRPPVHVHGFVAGRGPVSGARIHQRQEWLLKLDLRDFFPSVNFGRVFGLFGAFPFDYSRDVATVLAQLCCDENELPQGAPTSPLITNLICRRLDRSLAGLAAAERSYYTRYADDICFSTNRHTFPPTLAVREGDTVELGERLRRIVERNGFEINQSKTALIRRTQRQRLTGLVVNRKVNVSRHYVRRLRDLLYIWKKYELEGAEAAFARAEPPRGRPPGKFATDLRLIIRGRVQHVGSVKGWNSPVYQKLARSLKEVDPTFKYVPARDIPTEKVKLFTEGPTDLIHISAAQHYFHQHGEFLDFELITTEDSNAESDRQLLKLCEVSGKLVGEPTLCLFDTDTKNAQKAIGPTGIKPWGPLMVAVGLVPPGFRDPEKVICIELLYDDATLAIKDPDGRRIFRRDEFEDRVGRHRSENCTIPNPKNTTLIQEEVLDDDTNSIGMAKTDFADNIQAAVAPFDQVNFDGFRPTFETIREGVEDLKRPQPSA